MSAAGKTVCPVCGKQFNSAIISQHVNDCLSGEINMHESKSSARKRIPENWDFLTKRKTVNDGAKHQSAKKSKISDARGLCTDNDMRSCVGKGKTNASNSNSVTTSRALYKNKEDNNEVYHDSSDVELLSEENDDQLTPLVGINNSKEMSGKSTAQKTKFLSNFNHKATNQSENDRSSASKTFNNKPLAEQVRPTEIDQYVGQSSVVGKTSLLHSILQQSENIPSMIFWGPPGCGKTTLARIIAHRCRSKGVVKFITLSATSASVNDVKEIAKVAHNDQRMFHKKTILFLDEIHRFNKLQQDVLLPHVEDGTITFIGATTENPSFHVNGALLSRCRLVTLEKLQADDIKTILRRALFTLSVTVVGTEEKSNNDGDAEEDDILDEVSSPIGHIENQALDVLSGLVDGDGRAALNGLQLAVEGKLAERHRKSIVGQEEQRLLITVEDIKEGLQKSHILYDKTGEEHYNTVSAMIKSMRGSNANAGLYWLVRMLEGGENPLFVARRLVVFASEDIGLADPQALTQAVATYQACHFIGMPECAVNLSQCVVYLSRAPKSVEVYMALNSAKECVRKGPRPPVPLHLRNPSNATMRSLGYGKNYKYPPSISGNVEQDYFPPELMGTDFFMH